MKNVVNLMLVLFILSNGISYAKNGCDKHERRISDIERRLSEIEAIVKPPVTPPPSSQIPNCAEASFDRENPPLGFQCRTSKGIVFERIKYKKWKFAWKGPDSMKWSPFFGTWSFSSGTRFCQNTNSSMPSRKHFEIAENQGFRELYGETEYNWQIWTSTIVDGDSRLRYVFEYRHGSFANMTKDSEHGFLALICVSH